MKASYGILTLLFLINESKLRCRVVHFNASHDLLEYPGKIFEAELGST
jgi:hypothetical protein